MLAGRMSHGDDWFFTKEWAEAVREALAALRPGQGGQAAGDSDFFELIKSIYPTSSALGCPDPGAYLFVQSNGAPSPIAGSLGRTTRSRPTYVLGMDYPELEGAGRRGTTRSARS